MESKDRKRTREEEEEVSVEEKELEGTKKKAKTEDVEKSEANEKNEDEDEDDEAEEKEKGPLRELLRRTCWLPEVAPAYDVPAGSSEGDRSKQLVPSPSYLDLTKSIHVFIEQMMPKDWPSRRLSSGSTTVPT
jgi:hypothetical protein